MTAANSLAQEPQPSVPNGQALWPENCQPCHGPTGQGNGPATQSIPNPIPDLSDPLVARAVTPAEYFDIIKNGRIENMMPPWKNRFDDAQIWNLTAYVLSLSVTPDDLSAGEMIYQQSCATCHGDQGAGSTPDLPDFTTWSTISQHSLASWQANFLDSPDHATLADLREQKLWQTLAYVRTLAFAVPRTDGVLRGQVINATFNEPQASLDVTLHLVQNESEIKTVTTQADEQGRYTFEELPIDPSIQYIVEAGYQDIFYRSPEPAQFTGQANQANLDLRVYETTTDDSQIYVTQLHYLLSVGLTDVRVVQIFIIGNKADKTYIGQDTQTFQFSLPATAQNVTFQNDMNGGRFVELTDSYADTEPIIPGEESSTIVVTYAVPHDGRNLTLDVPLPTEVAAVSVLMQDRGASLMSEQLQFNADRQIQGDTFSVFTGTDLQAGETLVLRLTDLDKLTFSSPENNIGAATMPNNEFLDQETLRWVIMGVGGLTVLFTVLVYPRVRLSSQNPQTRRQKLLLMISQLDTAYEAGELAEPVYRQARANYKAELIKMIK